MIGRIVCSKAGRDKGYFMVVVAKENESYFVCDGKERPIERPKRKNAKHLSFTNHTLQADDLNSNKKLRKALAVFRNTADTKEEL